MKKIFCVLTCIALLSGCGAKAVPEWMKTGRNEMENFKKLYLQGRDRLAEISFEKALAEIKSSGDLELLQIAYLTRYAVQISALEDFEDTEYLRLAAVEPQAGNASFHAFLRGAFDRVDNQALPRQYRPFLHACSSGNQTETDRAIAAMEDPLSRLIASGVAVRKQLYHENTLNAAIRTASEQGWKKALLAYMNKLRDYYMFIGERNRAVLTQQKIDLIR